MTPDTQILRASKTEALKLLLVCGLFSAGGAWFGRAGDVMGWYCAAFFGIGLIISVVNLLPNSSYLTMNRDGFRIRSLFREQSFEWTDVETFMVRDTGHMKMVVFTFSKEYAKKFPAWLPGGLPDTYGLTAQDLADRMNAAKAAVLENTGWPPPPKVATVGVEELGPRGRVIPWNGWTHFALATGALGHTAYLADLWKPHLGTWLAVAVFMVPFVLVISAQVGDLRPQLVVQLHMLAALSSIALTALCVWLALTGYRPAGWMALLVMITPGFLLCAGSLPGLISLRGELERPVNQGHDEINP